MSGRVIVIQVPVYPKNPKPVPPPEPIKTYEQTSGDFSFSSMWTSGFMTP